MRSDTEMEDACYGVVSCWVGFMEETLKEHGDIQLSEGKHKVEVHYFNGGGGYYLNVLVQGPGFPRQILSPEFLSH